MASKADRIQDMTNRIHKEQLVILEAARNAIETLQTIIHDAEHGYLPRYTSHVQQFIDRMMRADAKIEGFRDSQ